MHHLLLADLDVNGQTKAMASGKDGGWGSWDRRGAEGHGDERTDEKGRRPLEGTNGGGINCGFQDRKQTGRSSAPA